MALFFRRPSDDSVKPIYTVGSNQSVLIVGLGNVGKQYQGTRHNIGFEVVDKMARDAEFPDWLDKKDLKAHLTYHNLGQTRVILCKPTTLMNLSGEAVQAIQHFYKIPDSKVLAVYDELALPFGQLRTRVGGSDAGHNGVKSLIKHIGPEFGRLRLGIGNDISAKADAADFVLGKFTKAEQAVLPLMVNEAVVLLNEYIFGSGQLNEETRTTL